MPFQKGHTGFRDKESYRKAAKKIATNANSARTRFKKGAPGFTGKHSEETKRKIREARARQGSNVWNKGIRYQKIAGESHWNWQGGLAKLHKTERRLFMETVEYKNWRRAVFERDDYTCQLCFVRGGELHADHIKKYSGYPELRLEVSNGRTLCKPCHLKTDNYGNKS